MFILLGFSIDRRDIFLNDIFANIGTECSSSSRNLRLVFFLFQLVGRKSYVMAVRSEVRRRCTGYNGPTTSVPQPEARKGFGDALSSFSNLKRGGALVVQR